MSKHTLLFHIGTVKTGSTTLQAFLQENQRELYSQGWNYPEIISNDRQIHKYTNGRVLCEALDDNDMATIDYIMNNVAELLESTNVIISCENFWFLNAKKTFSYAFLHPAITEHNVMMILYLRRQDRLIESYYSQHIVSRPHTSLNFDEYIASNMKQGFLNYWEKLQELKSAFQGEIKVRAFEKESLVGERHDIVSDFLEAIGLDSSNENWKFVANKNVSPNTRLLQIKRVINEWGLPDNCPPHRCSLYDACFTGLAMEDREKGYPIISSWMDSKRRAELLSCFEEGNKRVAQVLMGHEDGCLFQDMNLDIPYDAERLSPLDVDIIRSFTKMLGTLHNEFIQMTIDNTVHLRLSLDQIPLKKKLFLYGAGFYGQKCYAELSQRGCNIVSWIDKNAKSINIASDISLSVPDDVDFRQADYIVLTVQNASIGLEIFRELLRRGVDVDKIVMLS